MLRLAGVSADPLQQFVLQAPVPAWPCLRDDMTHVSLAGVQLCANQVQQWALITSIAERFGSARVLQSVGPEAPRCSRTVLQTAKRADMHDRIIPCESESVLDTAQGLRPHRADMHERFVPCESESAHPPSGSQQMQVVRIVRGTFLFVTVFFWF